MIKSKQILTYENFILLFLKTIDKLLIVKIII